MSAFDLQRTISRPAEVHGFGYLSGRDVRVEFRPAAEDSGIRFFRDDLPGCPAVTADIQHRVSADRRTVIQHGPARVELVEHVLASLAGLGIDNCELRINGPELPCCDGSALDFVDALDHAGVVALNARRRQCRVVRSCRVGDADCWLEARPSITGGFSIEYHLDYGKSAPIARQSVCLEINEELFRSELAPCRTFLLKSEADALLRQGVGSRVTPENLLVFDEHGPIQTELRFVDECARHKALDVVGDLALAGCDIAAHVVAFRSGHRHNALLAQHLTTLVRPQQTLMPSAVA